MQIQQKRESVLFVQQTGARTGRAFSLGKKNMKSKSIEPKREEKYHLIILYKTQDM